VDVRIAIGPRDARAGCYRQLRGIECVVLDLRAWRAAIRTAKQAPRNQPTALFSREINVNFIRPVTAYMQ
jgi:hypothetical protein